MATFRKSEAIPFKFNADKIKFFRKIITIIQFLVHLPATTYVQFYWRGFSHS
jgi:hypothetical protein